MVPGIETASKFPNPTCVSSPSLFLSRSSCTDFSPRNRLNRDALFTTLSLYWFSASSSSPSSSSPSFAT